MTADNSKKKCLIQSFPSTSKSNLARPEKSSVNQYLRLQTVGRTFALGLLLGLECLLDGLDLLRDGRQHPLLQTVKLVKTAPGAHLTHMRRVKLVKTAPGAHLTHRRHG